MVEEAIGVNPWRKYNFRTGRRSDYLYAGLFTVGPTTRTMPVFLGNYITSYSTMWGQMYAAVATTIAITVLLLMLSIAAGVFWRRGLSDKENEPPSALLRFPTQQATFQKE